MFAGPSIKTRDLRRWWIAAAVVAGTVAALTISAVGTVVAATVIGALGLAAFHRHALRDVGVRAASVSVGLLIPAVPLSLVHLIDML
jgi:hypothetical protein